MIDRIRVRNYRSIQNSGWVEMDEPITTLVGGNEAGKTNFLEAITLLGDVREVTEDELCDFKYDGLANKEKSEILILEAEVPSRRIHPERGRTVFGRKIVRKATVEGEVIEYVEDNSSESQVIVRRYADGTHRLDFQEDNEEEWEYLRYLISNRIEQIKYGVEVQQIGRELSSSLEKLRRHFERSEGDDKVIQALNEIETYLLENRELITESVKDSDSEKSAGKLIDETTSIINSYKGEKGILLFHSDLVRFPDIRLFNQIDEVTNEVKIKELRDTPEDNPAYMSLLQYAGLKPEQLPELDSGQIRERRQRVGEKLSDLLKEYWDQGSIDIKVELSGGRVSLHLYDESEARKQPSDRSTGLRWFLSFLTQVIAQSEEGFGDSLILLDDPGVHLHPKGHRDLRKALQKLAKDNQLIYSTHAPYMIDTDRLERIRVVERDEETMGTKVTKLGQKDTTSDDSLAPVRASLGATFSDSLLSSAYTILVEGFEDRIYLNRFSEYFRRTGNGPYFGADIKIVDCGGASKTNYMSRLVSAEGYDYAVLLDDDNAGRQAGEALIEEKIDPTRVCLVSDCINAENEATIEDLFSREFFCQVVSEVHDVNTQDLLDEIPDEKGSMIKDIDDAIKRIKKIDPDGTVLEKREIAKTINSGVSEGRYRLEDMSDETIDNFKSAITELIRAIEGERNLPARYISENEDETRADTNEE